MSERKNIDRLFQEKFKDFEAVPTEQVWENIEAELTRKKKRRVIPFWFRLSGVAAALLIGFFIANQFFFNEGQPQDSVVYEDNNGVQPQDKAEGQDKKIGMPAEGIAVDNNSGASQKNDPVNGGNGSNVLVPVKANTAIPTNRRQAVTQAGQENNNPGSENQKTGLGKNPYKNNIIEKEVHLKPVQKIAAAEQPKSEKTSSSNNRPHNLNGNNNNLVLKENNTMADTDKNSTNKAAATQVKDEKNSTGNQDLITPDSKLPNKTTNDPNGNPQANGSQIAGTTDLKKTDTTAIATVVPNALEELLNEKEEKKQLTTAEPKLNRWQITSNVAPIYFSSTSSGSPLDSRFENNKKTYVPTVAYGAGVRYAINKKLAVRSGVNAVALEYKTTDLIFFQTPNARGIENVNSNIQGSLIQVDNTPIPMAATMARTIKQYNGSLTQKTGYVEVPVEMSYKIMDRKFGVEVIGGFSTLFLNQNEVSLVGEGLDMNIGEANNLSSLHFSTNVGLGVKYNFWKSFQAHFEPTFKYQINTYSNNAGNFKPYFFGLYTGLSYHF